ncbi:MAG: amidohydrolase family protein, partial [Actinomycetota bacterium]
MELGDDGMPSWIVGQSRVPILVGNGAAGRPPAEWNRSAARYEDFRPGTVSSTERLRDMDISGVWSSLCFPSIPWGFAGTRFLGLDEQLGTASIRAYNDWVLEEWTSAAPDRFIPCQLIWLADPEVAARDIIANAARGFRAISFPENPEPLGLPSIYDRAWDPVFAACEETGTVVC